MSFLTAEWRKLILVNYEIDPSVLLPHLPFGTELDLYEGKSYVSLVGFKFVNTKMLGMKIPFHVNFEEVNLRFYVKRIENGNVKRGVVFIKEIVPKFAISTVANVVYGENYETMRMRHQWIEKDNGIFIEYSWKKKGRWHYLNVEANKSDMEIPAGSKTEFITEHYWGYAHKNDKKSHEYEVTHPRWKSFEVKSHEINLDFGLIYGDEFAFLNQQEPASVMLAEGSEITIEKKRIIT